MHPDGTEGRGTDQPNPRSSISMHLAFRHLREFEAVVDTGSFRRAALELSMSQSAISQAIRHVEGVLHIQLFDRQRGTNIRLTRAGELFLEFTRSALPQLDSLDVGIRSLLHPAAGERVSLGAGFSVTKYRLMPAITRFQQQNPKIKVNLRIGFSASALASMVLSNELDLAVYSGTMPYQHFRCLGSAKDRLKLFACPQNPILAVSESERPKLLNEAEFAVSPPDTLSRALAERWASTQGIEMNVVFEAQSLDALKSAAASGVALGFIPDFAAKDEIEAGTLLDVPVSGLPIGRTLWLIADANKQVSPATQMVAKYVAEGFERSDKV